jgi:alpha-glucosidase
MITLETIIEGFALVVDGKKVLVHSRRSPCVEIGVAENLVRQVHDSFKLRSRRCIKAPLRSFKVLESSPDLVVVDFEGKLVLAARQQGRLLRFSFSRFDSSINHFRLRLAAWPDERIFGCGASSDRLDRKGGTVRFWAQDRGIASGRGPLRFLARLASDLVSDKGSSSFPSPAFISTKGYWCAVDCPSYTTMEFHRNATVIDSWSVPCEVVWGYSDGAPAMVTDMSDYLGRQPALPDWCFDGAWLEVRGGSKELERRLDTALQAGVKVSALWSRDWCGVLQSGPGTRAARSFSWDGSLYPDLPRTIAGLRGKGIRFLGYITPLLDPSSSLYAEASRGGYCVKAASGEDYLVAKRSSSAAMIDLTNSEACAWVKAALRRELLGIGMSGYLADAGEELPADAVLASGENAAAAHNRWPLLWAQLGREAISEQGASASDTVLLARSGALGSAKYVNAFWLGERLTGFWEEEGLPGVVPAAISLGLSGGGSSHSEAGGSLSFAWARRSPECLCRWIELSAFSPILRIGDGFRPEANAQFWSDPLCLASLARMSEVYAALKPYHLAVASEQSESGLPPIRHPWLYYESDVQAEKLSRQYLYGRDLMVAPTLASKAQLTELYLPADEWVHLWTSRSFRGGRISVESPLGCPAVFYRAASPFAPLFDALRRTTGRGRS